MSSAASSPEQQQLLRWKSFDDLLVLAFVFVATAVALLFGARGLPDKEQGIRIRWPLASGLSVVLAGVSWEVPEMFIKVFSLLSSLFSLLSSLSLSLFSLLSSLFSLSHCCLFISLIIIINDVANAGIGDHMVYGFGCYSV